MMLARSLGFFKPANTILVPGMYFLGLTRYASSTSVVHTMPELLLAAEKEKPAVVPAVRPIRPCLWGPPCSTVWHCEHLVLKILAPFLADIMTVESEYGVVSMGSERS